MILGGLELGRLVRSGLIGLVLIGLIEQAGSADIE